MTEPLSDEWVAAAIEASAGCVGTTGVVAIAIGKKKRAVLEIVDGEVTAGRSVGGEDPGEVGVTIPVTGAQLGALLSGDESLAQAFMRGDIKPEGATGPLLAAIGLFEDEVFRSRLSSSLA